MQRILQHIPKVHLLSGCKMDLQYLQFFTRHKSAEINGQITIGDVTKELRIPQNPELVPRNYVQYTPNGQLQLPQTALQHLRWMLQKDELKQDMFLIGLPGPLRRHLAMQFLELTQRELEYISLSRDTTESDLKQRREIKNKAATYYDQCAVRAAVHGRVLVLDGVEHAERNVLPVLNNLLENREMHLENGKFLMSPERFDKLLETHSEDQLAAWGLLRVSEEFRVIALGLPTQKYKGTPLDPPLRSRFQSRNVTHFTYEEMFEDLQRQVPLADVNKLKSLLSFGFAVQNADVDLNLPDFPLHGLYLVAKIMQTNPETSMHEIIQRVYPYQTTFKTEHADRIKDLLQYLKIPIDSNKNVQSISIKSFESIGSASVDFQIDDLTVTVPRESQTQYRRPKSQKYVDLQHQRNLLSNLLQTYAVGDVCLVGLKGVGKNTLIQKLLDMLQQTVEPMMIYEDMTSRDLIQQRVTTIEGDTVWRDSPLIRAAKSGAVALLDGVHHLHKSTAMVLQRIIQDREVQLCDGTLLLRHDRYDALLREGFTKLELSEKNIQRLHEAFRIIALAEPATPVVGSKNWLTSEMLSLFMFLEVRPLQQAEEYRILEHLYGATVVNRMQPVVELAHILRASTDPALKNLAGTLSTRQLLKIARRLATYADTDINELLKNTFLIKFMPALPKAALEQLMQTVGIQECNNESENATKAIVIEGNQLKVGNTSMQLTAATDLTKVPNTLFYEMPQHVSLLERLLQDFLMGEHLLLVGNQGVGKNKLVDKLLHLMQKSREYLQLHRDTTVHTLTVQTTLRDGQVVYEDSALVKAVKYGHILVIDEADKAPVNVTCILRTLVERGEMMLSDGRKIVPAHTKLDESIDNLIVTHENFRVIILANRPGFPFLGNDFFAALGDVFSCHAIDNPSAASEIYLLKQYAPDVPSKTITTLVNAFGELRSMADEGLLNYPYSTRELVNIVRHLQRYPEEHMSELVGNVLDFDRYQPAALDQVTQVLAKHGLPIEAYMREELQTLRAKQLQATIHRTSGLGVSGPKFGKIDEKNKPHVGGNTWAGGTGGRDTAGLGGKGGPFRLDAGHKVHQLSDEEKDAVPEEIKRAAREMNRKAYEEKLREIRMSEHDHRLYAQFSDPIRRQVLQLQAMLEALQTRSTERQWQKYQTQGELDDTRLIEGVTGERNIYKKRGESNPWADNVQEKPHRMKLVVDVSGSMYRFNGYDGRLDRELEAVVMVMEAFDGFEHKIVYDIVGHSGEGWNIPFVMPRSPPKTDKERFETLRMLHAHSQFCWSGDNTVKAINDAIKTLDETSNDYDNNLVVVLSDANLARYGIDARDVAKALTKGEPKVKAHVIFIGSLAEEAQEINNKMPAGRSFVCMDVTKLPQILKQIFTSTLM